MRRRLAAFAVLLGLAGEARGDDGGQVIVIVTRQDGVFSSRVRAELESVGFRVVVRRAVHRGVPDGSVAVARIIGEPPSRIEIQTAGHLEETVIAVDASGSSADVGSIQAAERVRAYFQPLAPRRTEPEIAASVAPAAPPVAAPPVAAPPVAAIQLAAPAPALQAPTPPSARTIASAPPRPRSDAHTAFVPRERLELAGGKLGLTLGLGLPIDAWGVGVDAMGSFWFSPLYGMRIEPLVVVPLEPTSLEDEEGTADVYAGMLGILASGTLVDGSKFELAAGGGFAGVWFRTVGHASSGYLGRRADVITASFLVDVLLRAHVHESISIGPRAMLGVAVPTPDVQFDGRSVGRWGLPLGQLAATIELHP